MTWAMSTGDGPRASVEQGAAVIGVRAAIVSRVVATQTPCNAIAGSTCSTVGYRLRDGFYIQLVRDRIPEPKMRNPRLSE